MPDRRRFAIGVPPLLALLGVAAAILLPAAAAPAAAQSTEPAVTCFEITVGWRICAASAPEPPPPCQGVACIESAPGAFEQRTFVPGARIGLAAGHLRSRSRNRRDGRLQGPGGGGQREWLDPL